MGVRMKLALAALKSGKLDETTMKPVFYESFAKSFGQLETKHLWWAKEALEAEILRRKENKDGLAD